MFETRAQIKELSDTEVADGLTEQLAIVEQAMALALEYAGEFDRRQLWAFDGAGWFHQWLANNTGMPRADAKRFAGLARRLREDMPVTAEALADGEITTHEARVLASAVNPRTVEAFAEHEEFLVGKSQQLPVDELAKVVRRWKQLADQDGPVPAFERLLDRRYLKLSRDLDGMTRLEGRFAPEFAAQFRHHLDTVTDQLWRAENADDTERPRTLDQRRADAFQQIFRRSLAAAEMTNAAQPLMIVRTDVETLNGAEGESSLEHGEIPIPAATARRLACDSILVRLVMSRKGVPLEMGQAVRTATLHQKLAIVERDGGTCVASGCGIPVECCHAHHLHWWEHGGPTNLANLAMVCHRHHHLLHEGGCTLTRNHDGTYRLERPLSPPPHDPRPPERPPGCG